MYLIIIILKMKKIKINFIIKSFYNFKLLILIIIINIAGLPPFRFFIIKWFRIFFISIKIKFNIILLLILFRSLLIIYIYNNIIIKITLLYSYNSKLLYTNNFNINKYNLIIINFLIFSSLIIIIILDFKLI